MKNRFLDKLSRVDTVERLAVGVSDSVLSLAIPAFRRIHGSTRVHASGLRRMGKGTDAIEALRNCETRYGKNCQTSILLAGLYLEQGQHFAARQSVLDALQLEPALVTAFERFLEIEPYAPLGIDARKVVFAKFLESSVDKLAVCDQLAVSSFIFDDSELARKLVQKISDSGRGAEAELASMILERHGISHGRSPSGDSDHSDLAKLHYATLHGRNKEAFSLAAKVDVTSESSIAIRMAASRELRKGEEKVSSRYLRLLSETAGVSTGEDRKLLRSAILRKEDEIFKNGFPFSDYSSDTPFEPVANRSLYFLHNSLPFNSAGYATRTHGLLTALNRLGWDPEGLTRLGYPSDAYDYSIDEVPESSSVGTITYHHMVDSSLPRMPKTPVWEYQKRYVEHAQRVVEDRKPLLLHAASNHWNGLTVAELARRYRLPSIYEVRGLWEVTRGSREPEYFKSDHYMRRAAIEADAARACDRVITITNALKREMVERGVPEEKITVVPNGVDTSRFKPLAKDAGLAEQLGIDDRVVVGYVGSVLDYEGLDLLVKVASRILKRRSDVVFIVVGDGAAWQALKALVEEEGLQDDFILTGRVPHEEVEKYYSLIDICPFPRRPLPVCEMVSPLKPFEALAMEKVVLVSNVAAMAEIIDEGVTGLHYQKGDPDSLEEQLTRLIDDAQLRRRLASNGLEWVRGNRDWNSLGKLVGEIYKDLGGHPGSAAPVGEW